MFSYTVRYSVTYSKPERAKGEEMTTKGDLKTEWEKRLEVDVKARGMRPALPFDLAAACVLLQKLRDEGDQAFIDELSNDADEVYPAIMEALNDCAAAVKDLSKAAKTRLEKEVSYHESCAQKIRALGVV